MSTQEEYGRIAYDAYCESVGFVSHYTQDALPEWDNLAEPVQVAWCSAANAVLGHLMLIERGKV